MQQAERDMEQEIAVMERESEQLLMGIRAAIGDLSDLRYGRLNHSSGVGKEGAEDVIEGLTTLEQLAARAANG